MYVVCFTFTFVLVVSTFRRNIHATPFLYDHQYFVLICFLPTHCVFKPTEICKLPCSYVFLPYHMNRVFTFYIPLHFACKWRVGCFQLHCISQVRLIPLSCAAFFITCLPFLDASHHFASFRMSPYLSWDVMFLASCVFLLFTQRHGSSYLCPFLHHMFQLQHVSRYFPIHVPYCLFTCNSSNMCRVNFAFMCFVFSTCITNVSCVLIFSHLCVFFSVMRVCTFMPFVFFNSCVCLFIHM